jgi:hypothetical protein
MLRRIQKLYSANAYNKRRAIFMNILKPTSQDKIMDLGGGNGSLITNIIQGSQSYNITSADILQENLDHIKLAYKYSTVLIPESDRLPFKDGEYDIVFCNSVIEHVTVPKEFIWNMKSGKEFKEQSLKRQKEFADEIRRVGKGYFVQTPNKYFLIESHSWLPGIVAILPRPILIRVLRFFNLFWPKKARPDWNLLSYRQMQNLFPDAIIYREKSLGFTKSLIAIKKGSLS